MEYYFTLYIYIIHCITHSAHIYIHTVQTHTNEVRQEERYRSSLQFCWGIVAGDIVAALSNVSLRAYLKVRV